jgi:predicted amidophosphoribosyltransferase
MSPPQQGTVIWGEYQGALRTAVLGLKHRGRDELTRPLGRRLAGRVATEAWASDIDLVVHVPSHPRCVLARRGMRRQAGRSRAQRLQLPRRSFRNTASVRGRRLLIIDDVTTTGATLRRAAEVLGEAGAEVVYCAAMARTPDPRKTT